MSVGRICCREVAIARPEETVLDAARRLSLQRVGTLVIVDGEQRPIGIITDRDLVVRVIAAGKTAGSTRLREVMTADVKTAHEDSAIEAALALMRAGGFRRLPVVDAQGQLVGIVSLDDVLALLAEEFAHIGRVVEPQVH